MIKNNVGQAKWCTSETMGDETKPCCSHKHKTDAVSSFSDVKVASLNIIFSCISTLTHFTLLLICLTVWKLWVCILVVSVIWFSACCENLQYSLQQLIVVEIWKDYSPSCESYMRSNVFVLYITASVDNF